MRVIAISAVTTSDCSIINRIAITDPINWPYDWTIPSDYGSIKISQPLLPIPPRIVANHHQYFLIDFKENPLQTNLPNLLIKLVTEVKNVTNHRVKPQTLEITIRQPVVIKPTRQ